MSADLHELAAAYALGAVDDLERAAFERHLRTCTKCQEEVASYDGTLVSLATSAPPVAPPASLKASLMEQVAATPQRSARHPEHSASAPTAPSGRSWATRGRLLAAAAGVAAAAVVGVAVIQPWEQPTSVVVASPAERVLEASDARKFTAAVDGARVILTMSPSQSQAAVQTERMPSAPAGHVYQLWYLDGLGQPRSAGVMRGEPVQLLEGTTANAIAAAITVEPTGGSKAPTTTPIVRVSMA